MARASRPCSVVGCPILLARAGRCPTHQREWEQDRGTRQERGYDRNHTRLRAKLLPLAYGQVCASPNCGLRMLPGQALALMHNEDRTGYLGMGHATCNNSDAGKAAHTPR